MPKEDRTGPRGQGAKTGRGQGRCNPEDGTSAPQRKGGMGTGRVPEQGVGRGAGQGRGKGRGAGQRRSNRQ